MMNLVVDLFGGLWAYVALAGAAIAGLFALYTKGRKDAARKAKIAALENYKQTRKAMDDVQIDDDIGVLHDSLRARDPHKR